MNYILKESNFNPLVLGKDCESVLMKIKKSNVFLDLSINLKTETMFKYVVLMMLLEK